MAKPAGDAEDDEADRIYAAIDERMANKRKLGDAEGGGDKIGDQFRELKEKLADVTEDQWSAIPEVGDYSLKYKQRRREEVFTPLPDSVLHEQAKGKERADEGEGAKDGQGTLSG